MYIHYGSDHFYPEYFSPVRNSDWQPKPDGGFWGCRVDSGYGWDHWCRDNRFRTNTLDERFTFELVDANVLTLTSPDQLTSGMRMD